MKSARRYLAYTFATLNAGAAVAGLLDDVRAADEKCDAEVASIRTVDELKAKQSAWLARGLAAMGGLPGEKTPLNARTVGVVECDGFRVENVIFESLPGIFVTAHLALPTGSSFKPPYPVVLLPLGHSNIGIRRPFYADQFAMSARAGFAALSWDPPSQGERIQCAPQFDGPPSENCSVEHTRLGLRAWLAGWNFMRFYLWDAIRAIDYAESRADLDCSRLGVMGTSGGGTMSAFIQAFDGRIKVSAPNCYVSSKYEVIRERGCHDAEQFFWNQLPDGLSHASLLAMGQPRVALAVCSRYKDYFPHKGAVATFAALTNMTANLGFKGPYWHFHCDGPHGLPLPTRVAQVDWMRHCILGGPAPKPIAEYQSLGGTGKDDDPAATAPLPFPEEKMFCTPTHQVRDLLGFRSLYSVIADRVVELAVTRRPKTREELREIVRRRAAIRPLAYLPAAEQKPFDHPRFGWWYLDGAYGKSRENEAAILATLGRSVVGRDAENVIIRAAAQVKANGGRPVPLVAKGWDCIAAAHAYAAEPQLFSEVAFTELPPSWTELARDPAVGRESYAVAVWGALEEYDWPDLVEERNIVK